MTYKELEKQIERFEWYIELAEADIARHEKSIKLCKEIYEEQKNEDASIA